VPEYLETVKRHFSKALNGEPQSYEAAVLAKDGRRIDIHITSVPIIINGEVIGIYGIAEDITGRKQMENQLVESEAKYRTVVENMHDVLYRTDSKGDITLVSPAATRLLVIDSIDQVIGRGLKANFIVRCLSGAGIDNPYFHEVAKRYAGKVHLEWRQVDEPRLFAYAASSDFCIYPSKFEMDTFLIAQGEAMVCGAVPIATAQYGMAHFGHVEDPLDGPYAECATGFARPDGHNYFGPHGLNKIKADH
jgi:hypothetical protein